VNATENSAGASADHAAAAYGPEHASRPGFYDPLADEAESASGPGDSLGRTADGRTEAEQTAPRPEGPKVMVEFLSPSQLKATVVPEGAKLVGDFHIERSSPFVLGGAPGVGKSRAAVALAVAGATGADWFGLPVHRRFRTMILQAENGRVRLKNEFNDLDCAGLDDWVCVTPPPPYGFAFIDRHFLTQLRAAITAFKPDVFIIDPWNQCVKDSTERDYSEGFDRVRACLPIGDDCPALGIVAHTRKPRLGEKAGGRGLLNLLSGSYVLASVPRAVFVVQPATEDTEDKRVVFTCCKNNNGQLGERSVWERRNGLFARVTEFNWEEFDGGGKAALKKGVTEKHLREVFEDGGAWIKLKEAVEKLMEAAGVGRTAAYEALRTDGEFGRIMHKREDGTVGLLNFGRSNSE
jgi:hypothetical protein